jgi:hypothetical protein
MFKKNPHTSSHAICVQSRFTKNWLIVWNVKKKIKFNAKIKLFMRYIFCSFTSKTKKIINFSQNFANAQTVEMYIQKKLEFFNNAYAAWAKLNFRLIHLFWNNTIPRLYTDAWFLTTQVFWFSLKKKRLHILKLRTYSFDFLRCLWTLIRHSCAV